MKQEREGKMNNKKKKKNYEEIKKNKKRKRIINKRNKRGNVKKHVQGFLEFRSLTSQWLLAIHIQSFSSKNRFLTKNWPLAFEFH